LGECGPEEVPEGDRRLDRINRIYRIGERTHRPLSMGRRQRLIDSFPILLIL